MIAKKQLRAELSAKRLALLPADWAARSIKICEKIAASEPWTHFQKIALYQSFRNEVDLSALPSLSPGKAYFYPKIDTGTGSMSFHKAAEASHFQKNSWGLTEPDGGGEILVPDPNTLIIVPALAFDRSGHRLGYGKGFYDRYLSRQSVATLGVCFSEFLFDTLPSESHDVPVQFIVSEQDLIRR